MSSIASSSALSSSSLITVEKANGKKLKVKITGKNTAEIR